MKEKALHISLRNPQRKHGIFLFSRIFPTLTQSRDVRYRWQTLITEIYLCIAFFFAFFHNLFYSLRHFERCWQSARSCVWFFWIFPCPHVMYTKLDCPLDQEPRFGSKEGNMAVTQNQHFLCFDVFGARYCVKWNTEDFLAMPYHGGHELLVKLSTLLQSHGIWRLSL